MRRSEFVRAAEQEGWTVTVRPGGHLALDHPDAAETVFTSATPSDHRWHLNTFATMRRALPPKPKVARIAAPREKRRPPPTHRPAPARDYPEPLAMLRTPPAIQPERRPVPPEPPPRHRMPGGPAGFRSCLNRI